MATKEIICKDIEEYLFVLNKHRKDFKLEDASISDEPKKLRLGVLFNNAKNSVHVKLSIKGARSKEADSEKVKLFRKAMMTTEGKDAFLRSMFI